MAALETSVLLQQLSENHGVFAFPLRPGVEITLEQCLGYVVAAIKRVSLVLVFELASDAAQRSLALFPILYKL